MANITIPVVSISSDEGKTLLHSIEEARVNRSDEVETAVREVLDGVQTKGDSALFAFTEKFEQRELTADTVRFSVEDIKARATEIDPELANSIKEAAKRIRAYHEKQKIDSSFELQTQCT